MAHPLVDQLRFTRAQVARSLHGVTEEEGFKRFGAINSLGWMVGHLANQEQRYWIQRLGKPLVVPGLQELVGNGSPASTPSITEMWAHWHAIIAAADPYLESLTETGLGEIVSLGPVSFDESAGTLLHRVIYHQWFHNGEAQAVRQLLGHTNLPQFVGNIGEEAPYRRD
jgi:hypothetical protein